MIKSNSMAFGQFLEVSSGKALANERLLNIAMSAMAHDFTMLPIYKFLYLSKNIVRSATGKGELMEWGNKFQLTSICLNDHWLTV